MVVRSNVLSRSSSAAWLVAAAALCASVAAHATSYVVGAGCDYTTIQSAINAAQNQLSGSRPIIYIARNQAYSAQTLTASNTSISFVGVATCNDRATSGVNTVISAAGGANAPVVKIVNTDTGNPINVNFDHITLQDGHAGGTDGGGLSFSGVGYVNLTYTTVFSNTANYGAGINFKSNGGAATLTIGEHTLVTSNTAAVSGGGIRIEGSQATLTMNAANTWIALNEATTGNGGGIEIINGAKADIGSPGYGNLAVIYDNTAKYGGGVSLGSGFLQLYTTDPLHPVSIDNNTAYNTGGGISLVPQGTNVGYLCATGYRITNNIAQEGTGLYSDVDTGSGEGSYVRLDSNPDNTCSYTGITKVPCDASLACSIVHGNTAMNVKNGNAPTDGAAILLQSGTYFVASKLDARDNHGGYVLRQLGNTITPTFYTSVHLNNCLFADNQVTHELILSSDGTSHLDLYNCTFAHDTIGASRVIAANDVLGLNDVIIDEGPLIAAIAFTGSESNLSNLYNIAGNTTGMAASPYNIQARPIFVDLANGDYRLFYGLQNGTLVQSPGIDYAPPAGGNDIRGAARDGGISSSPLFGTRDIGAYEMQGIADRIFIGTFGDSALLAN